MLNDDSILLPEKPVTQPGEITFNVRVGIMKLKREYLRYNLGRAQWLIGRGLDLESMGH